jgi:hypothetical protein
MKVGGAFMDSVAATKQLSIPLVTLFWAEFSLPRPAISQR